MDSQASLINSGCYVIGSNNQLITKAFAHDTSIIIMYLLRNGQIISVDMTEDSLTGADKITAVLTHKFMISEEAEKIRGYKSSGPKPVRDKIYQLNYGTHDYNYGKLIFLMTQSSWHDDSGLGNGLGYHDTKGEAIVNAMSYGYTVYIGDVALIPPSGILKTNSLRATY